MKSLFLACLDEKISIDATTTNVVQSVKGDIRGRSTKFDSSAMSHFDGSCLGPSKPGLGRRVIIVSNLGIFGGQIEKGSDGINR